MEQTTYSYEFRTGDYFKAGFKLFKEKPETLLLFSLILWLVYLGLGYVPIAKFFRIFWLAIAHGGMFLIIQKQAETGSAKLEDASKVADFMAQIILLQIVTTALLALGFLCLIIPGIYLSIAYQFAVPHVVLGKMNFWDAMERSRKVITANWWAVAGFTGLWALLNIVGFCFLLVGVLVTGPITSCALYYAYKDVERQIASATPNAEIQPSPT